MFSSVMEAQDKCRVSDSSGPRGEWPLGEDRNHSVPASLDGMVTRFQHEWDQHRSISYRRHELAVSG